MLGFHSMSNFSLSVCGRQHSTQVPLCSTANVSLGMSELGVQDQQCSATGACGVNAWPPPVPPRGAVGGWGWRLFDINDCDGIFARTTCNVFGKGSCFVAQN